MFKGKIKTMLLNLRLLPVFSFIAAFSILYLFDPKLFETMWKGRAYYLFFLWLMLLETISSWETNEPKIRKFKSIRTTAFIFTLLLPSIYIVWTNLLGLNAFFVESAGKMSVPFAAWMPIAYEYLFFMIIFTVIVTLEYGVSQLVEYSISVLFLGIVGLIFLVDNMYPYGQFTPFQLIVPTTTHLAANILSLMGYKTTVSLISNHPIYGTMPFLKVENSQGGKAGFYIGWPCSGVESLMIYSITISLFLKKSPVTKVRKVAYFVIGAMVTYGINILRIVTIFIIAISNGDWKTFHDYYGQLYSVLWITSYPLIIISTQKLLDKVKGKGLNLLKSRSNTSLYTSP